MEHASIMSRPVASSSIYPRGRLVPIVATEIRLYNVITVN